MNNGKLVIVSGPSGVGKDTVIDAWCARNSAVQRVVACTTRLPRSGEIDGVDYHFLTENEFMRRADEHLFIEFKKVHGNWYATPADSPDTMISEGKIAILKIDVHGAMSVMQLRPEAITVFLMPPSPDELERRIRSRATESAETIELRLEAARIEMALSDEYQYSVVNESVEHTVAQLEEIVR